MSKNKTQITTQSPQEYLQNISPQSKQQDCFHLLEMMQEITNQPTKMWGTRIIGLGKYFFRSYWGMNC